MLIQDIKNEMLRRAKLEAEKAFDRIGDGYPCGFAWVDIVPKYAGNTRLGRAERSILRDLGFELSSNGKTYTFWNPSKHPAQNMDVKLAGAKAASDFLRTCGFNSHYSCRFD